jgi:capsular exopolysaccharide synthesis family protein
MTKGLTGEPLSNIEAIGPASVKVIEQAQIPLQPSGPPKILIALLAVCMSIFLGVMLAYAFEYMDQTFKSPQEVESYLNLPFLGSIPQNATLHNYRTLADQIYLLMKDKGIKTLLIGASVEREGVTTTVTNLGTYLSKTANHKVLIIDANLRNPGVYKFPKAGEGVGIGELLEDKTSFDKAIKDIGNNLCVLPAGKTNLNPITLLSSRKMQELVKQAKEQFEIVLIDSPELNNYKDALLVATYVDAVAIVVNEGKTRKQVVKAAIQPLIEGKANVIGVILNRRVFAIPRFIYNRI